MNYYRFIEDKLPISDFVNYYIFMKINHFNYQNSFDYHYHKNAIIIYLYL
jgi:hypothetical protein